MMKKIIMGIAFCVSIGACVDRNTHDYPQASKDAFLNACKANSGGKEKECSCMLTKVQEKYTYGEMMDIEEKIKSGKTPPEFTEFMTKEQTACMMTGSGSSTTP